ncbi:hypothetical protein [Streptomyces canus]|uniref:hypothetical protein n=1 Tax=Streptomyces canus TaxID=58343 RepID=UPI002E31424D|nr:hypothetical protein [Streptomyces canus]
MTDEIHRLREERRTALQARGRTAAELARARSALAEAARRGASEEEQQALKRDHRRVLGELEAARADERRALAAIGDLVAELPQSPIDLIDRLDARFPVAFFPVRIETRFVRSGDGGELLVRIYPDGLLAQTHEPLLTDVEAAAGKAYWQRIADGRPEAESWSLMLTEAEPTRAAWIVERTEPADLTAEELDFPVTELRPPGWHQAPEAPTLPDRWIVTAYRDRNIRHRAFSAPVRDGLALTLRLSTDGEEPGLDDAIDLSGDGLEIEPELRWVYDFEEAQTAGMAVRVAVTAEDLRLGFSTVLVTGVRTTADPAAQAGELEALLDGHRFSRGLAFVPQGAQTNNSQDAPSAYPADDPGGTASFAVARGAPRAAPGTDGHRFMTALGLDPATADHVAGADRDEQEPARAMVDALWPATIGYFLDQLMAPEVAPATRRALRAHMRAHVRPRGPYPAFRVGSLPYGLLPVSALSRWQPKRGKDPLAAGLPARLRRLARLWLRFTGQPPHIGRSGDPDADLVETLGQDASAQVAQIRRALGHDAMHNMLGFMGIGVDRWRELRQRLADGVLDDLGEPGWDPRVLHLTFADRAYDYRGPLVTKDPLSEADPLAFDYIAWLRTASPAVLREQVAPPTEEPVDALLYLMLRHALLAEYNASALDLLTWRRLTLAGERTEPELVQILPVTETTPARRTAWERFDTRIAGVTGAGTVGTLLADPRTAGHPAPQVRAIVDGLNGYRASLRALEGLPTAELDRLFTETLDTCSHRLDPWITGLYTQRLEEMRGDQPRGLYVGCYGWVEQLAPDPAGERVPVTTTGGDQEQARTDSGGYVYAPSMLHGATAAVLRSAYLTRADQTYAIDLSSRRTRAAIQLVDSVRDDQPLGAALGYAFERGLHEGRPGVELDQFIDEFRSLYPLVANKATDSGEPAESVAARNVIDGLRLRAAWTAGDIPWDSGGLTPTGQERTAIEAELARLDDAVDAVADLLLAESVHQVLRGSTAGAGATLDSLAKGHRPPEPEVASTPRGGAVLHQRVALVVSTETLPPAWDALGPTPRAVAAPELNAWLARLIGPPDAIACTATPDGGAAVTVTAEALALQPIDLLLLASATDAGAPSADLDRRVALVVAAEVGADTALEIDYTDSGGEALSLAEVLEVLAETARALGHARPLEPRDLLPPERESSLAEADPLTAEADGRAAAAELELAAVVTALDDAADIVTGAPDDTDPDLGDLRGALRRAADLGIAGAVPAGLHDHSTLAREALLELAAGVAAALDERVAADAADAPSRLRAVFGREFPVLPRFLPAATDLLATALAAEPDLGPDGDAAVETWLGGAFRVREPLDSWRQVTLYARAFAAGLPRPRIVQLPLEAPARWAALDYDGGPPHPSGLCSLALFGSVPAADGPWSGLLLDAWPEILPNAEEDASVVFHYDAPGAQAPACVLLAVPPTHMRTWSHDVLEETLLETLETARMRALDLGDLGRYGQVLPMTYLAANPQNAAIATSFVGLAMADALIVEP